MKKITKVLMNKIFNKNEEKTPITTSSTSAVLATSSISAVLLANGYIRNAQEQSATEIPKDIWQLIETFFYSAFCILDTVDKTLIGDTNSIKSNSNAYLQHQYESYYYFDKYFLDSDSPYEIAGIVYSRIKFLDDSELEILNKKGEMIKLIPSYPYIGSGAYGSLINQEILVNVVKKRHIESLNSPVLFAVCTAKSTSKKKGAFLLFYSSYYLGQGHSSDISLRHNYNIPWKSIVEAWSIDLRLHNQKNNWEDKIYKYQLEPQLYVLSISEKEANDIINHNKEYYTCDQINSKSLESRFPFFNIFSFLCRNGCDAIEDLRNFTYLNKILTDFELGRKYFYSIDSSKKFTREKLQEYRNNNEPIGGNHGISSACPYIYMNKINQHKKDNKNKENKENFASVQNQFNALTLFRKTVINKKRNVKGEYYECIGKSYQRYVSICRSK